MAERPSRPRPSALLVIWVGMPVTDVTGRLVGSVKYVKHGRPAAVTYPPDADEDLDTAFARGARWSMSIMRNISR